MQTNAFYHSLTVALLGLCVVACLVLVPSFARAEANDADNKGMEKKMEKTEGTPVPTLYEENGTSAENEDDGVTEEENSQSTDVDAVDDEDGGNMGKGSEMSAAHRSTVATFVQNLKALGDRDGGIGQEVRAVAQEQQDIVEESEEAIASIENRSKFQNFLFGTDYRSVGVLRSNLVTTQNHIARLESAMDRTEDEGVKADLQVEIDALQSVHDDVETFIVENEDQFSLLGWLAKLIQ